MTSANGDDVVAVVGTNAVDQENVTRRGRVYNTIGVDHDKGVRAIFPRDRVGSGVYAPVLLPFSFDVEGVDPGSADCRLVKAADVRMFSVVSQRATVSYGAVIYPGVRFVRGIRVPRRQRLLNRWRC